MLRKAPTSAHGSVDLISCADYRLSRHGPSTYIARPTIHVTRQLVAEWLEQVWADPEWRQPWAIIVALQEDSTYDLNLRDVPIPPPEQRAIITAVVSPKALHRMVVSTMGIAMKLSHRFQVIACPSIDDALRETGVVLADAARTGRTH